MPLTKSWICGDHSAFSADPDAVEWAYGAVNLVFYPVGLGLVTLGVRRAAKRSWASTTPTDRRGSEIPVQTGPVGCILCPTAQPED